MLDISMINPYIRVAMHSVLPAKSEIKRRVIFDYELIYIADGEFVLIYDDISYPCKQGQFLFLRPGISHSFCKIECDLVQPHIHFDITHTDNSTQVPISFKDMDALTEKEKGWICTDAFRDYPKTPFVAFSDQEKAFALFYEITHSPNISMLNRKAKLIQLIEMLIVDNFPSVFKQRQNASSIEKHVKAYIDAGQGLTAKLEDIAKQFNYSKYYLDRCFKENYGSGVMAYRNQKRMLLAQQMLKGETVSAVAEKLGFSSIYVFSRAFKKHFGISPTSSKKAE